jgi:MtN3 and saliva related transmembrane protein
MIKDFAPWIGAFAAALTSLSYVPQVRKAWPRGSTDDLSLTMLVVLTVGFGVLDRLRLVESRLGYRRR